jgi:hypothetical protein
VLDARLMCSVGQKQEYFSTLFRDYAHAGQIRASQDLPTSDHLMRASTLRALERIGKELNPSYLSSIFNQA